ncbi:hypothetical protein EU91_0973 [Prochlorococcus marinus str. GP2]|uniref:Uncharacterized protein n=1 Tax=Prochlorococcus marinus str. GP2 TaxID=59925 RepID=A0A0A1ZIA0_PROMR|nr:hypothetical protein EU91_0973 [Prochlorococcus marinus str. GP2]
MIIYSGRIIILIFKILKIINFFDHTIRIILRNCLKFYCNY